MYGLSDANQRIRRIVGERRVRWESVARWGVTAFLAAGGLLLLTTLLMVLTALTGTAWEMLPGITGFLGLVLLWVGVLGLYPRVADRTPRLAGTGVALVALSMVTVFVLLVWGTLGHTLSIVPIPIVVIPAFGVVFVATFLMFALGTTLFGVASLRSGRLPRAVGLLLFALAGTWFVMFGAGSMYGAKFPAWFDSLTSGIMAVVTLAIWYQLRAGSVQSDRAGRASDPTG